MLSTVSQGAPQQNCVQVAQSGTPIGFYFLAVLSGPLPKKLLPKILSQGLFGDERQFMKTVYDSEAITPSSTEHE